MRFFRKAKVVSIKGAVTVVFRTHKGSLPDTILFSRIGVGIETDVFYSYDLLESNVYPTSFCSASKTLQGPTLELLFSVQNPI